MAAAATGADALAPPPAGASMDALTFRGKQRIAFERVPVPRLEAPGDVLVRVDLAAICGSDMHPVSGWHATGM